jgi:hypothetical protein
LKKGLTKFRESFKDRGIKSVAFPLLGAHNGGLSKRESLNLIGDYLADIEIPVEVYQFDPDAPDDLFDGFKEAFLSTSVSSLKKLTGLREDKIEQLLGILREEELQNMGKLANYKGIGDATIAKCFNYAMRPDLLNIQLNIF